MRAIPVRVSSSSFWGALTLVALGAAVSFGQGKPPASIPEQYRQKFVKYVDRRSITEKVLNLVGLTSQDVGRSFALIAGVSKYPNMPDPEKEMPAAAADIEALQNYLRTEEFFDEIVVLKDGDVTEDNLKYFLEDYFPDRLRSSPKSASANKCVNFGVVDCSSSRHETGLSGVGVQPFADRKP